MIVITSATLSNLAAAPMGGGNWTVRINVSTVDSAEYIVNSVKATLYKNASGIQTAINPPNLTLTKIAAGQWQTTSPSFPAASGDIISAEVTASCSYKELETATAIVIP